MRLNIDTLSYFISAYFSSFLIGNISPLEHNIERAILFRLGSSSNDILYAILIIHNYYFYDALMNNM